MPEPRYELHFKCCGNDVRLGTSREVGAHGDYCLACDTEAPATEVRRADA